MKIAYITSTFPYGAGEGFLGAEIRTLSTVIEKLIVIPARPRGKLREEWSSSSADVKIEATRLLSYRVWNGVARSLFENPLGILRALIFLLRNSELNAKLLKNLLVLPKAIWLSKYMARNDISHLHVHWGGTTSTIALLSCLISKKSWSLTCHRWDIYENNLLALKSEKAQFIRFISKRGAKDALEYGVNAKKSVIIPMGVLIERRPPVLELSRKRVEVICAANLIEIKGHKYLLEAIAILKARGREIHLSVAGEGPLRKSLEELTTTLNLQAEISFLGQVGHAELMRIYQSRLVDIFVLPSVELDSENHEGVPVSLMEAMSFGIPCISTKTGSIEELLEEKLGMTVAQQNAQELAEKIDSLIQDPALYKKTSTLGGEILISRWTSSSSVMSLMREIKLPNSEEINLTID